MLFFGGKKVEKSFISVADIINNESAHVLFICGTEKGVIHLSQIKNLKGQNYCFDLLLKSTSLHSVFRS